MFRDREDAGRRLADLMESVELTKPLVLGLPRGGVPVAKEVAARLGADLDIVLVRKIGHPHQPELALGAIGESGARYLNDNLIRQTRVRPEEIEAITAREGKELERRAQVYRATKPRIPIAGRDVVIVDDGIATGATTKAAIEVVRQAGAHRIVLAVPVAPRPTAETFEGLVDEVVIVDAPRHMGSVGQFYRRFAQVTDDEVLEALGTP